MAWKEAVKNKLGYILGLSTVFLVVFIVSMLLSVIDAAPLIFLGLAEQSEGQIDLRLFNLKEDVRFNVSDTPFNASPRREFTLPVFKALDCVNNGVPVTQTQMYRGQGLCGLTEPQDCLLRYCGEPESMSVLAIDSELEKSLQIGPQFPSPLNEDEVILSTRLANSLNANVGDALFFVFSLDNVLLSQVRTTLNDSSLDAEIEKARRVVLSYTIRSITSNNYLKTQLSDNSFAFIEHSSLQTRLGDLLNPSIAPNVKTTLLSFLSKQMEYATSAVVPCSDDRNSCYSSASYDEAAFRINLWADGIRRSLGFQDFGITLPVLRYLSTQRLAISSLNLLLSLIILILGCISVFLIYSLLMVSVESKVYETGITRMIGFSKPNVYTLLLYQGLSYAIPATLFGLLSAQVSFIFLVDVINGFLGISISPILSVRGYIVALFLGILIPLFSSIFPIRKALSVNIQDALERRQSSGKPKEVSLERTKSDKLPLSLIAGGLFSVTIGFSVYYLLPLALVNDNIVLLFNIFFGLLMLMLVGLTVLSINFEFLLQKTLLDILFIVPFEKVSMKQLVYSNLKAHKSRNKKTSLVFSIALSFIIFLTVTGDTQLTYLDFVRRRTAGTIYALKSNDFDNSGQAIGFSDYLAIESFLLNRTMVQGVAWSTYSLLDWDIAMFESSRASNTGGTFQSPINVFSVSPNFLHVMDTDFIEVISYKEDPIEALYTSRNKSLLMGQSVLDDIIPDDNNMIQLVTRRKNQQVDKTRVQVVASFGSFPKFRLRRYSGRQNAAITDVFSLYQLANRPFTGFDSIPIEYIFIKTKPLSAKEEFLLFRDLDSEFSAVYEVVNLRPVLESSQFAKESLTTIFQFVSIIVILLMFFSLNSSMSINIIEQQKEIGILRSLGLTNPEVFRLYVYEASVLVFVSGCLGIVVGAFVSWTMTAQQAILSNLPIFYSFPYEISLIVLSASILCGIMAIVANIKIVLGKGIVGLLK